MAKRKCTKTIVKGLVRLEVEEMLKHKWIESEKAGYDLGEKALIDWAENHSEQFFQEQLQTAK